MSNRHRLAATRGETRDVIHRRLPLVLCAAMVFAAGCRRAAEPVFEASAQVQQLPAELRRDIEQVLERYCGTPRNPRLLCGPSRTTDELRQGAALYNRYCVQCHGVTGDGAGPAGAYLDPRPRDYRRGIFKFTSTPYGAKPRRADLARTIRVGVSGTAMPPFALLTDVEIEALVDYVLVLTHRGELETLLAFEAETEEELDPGRVAEYVADICSAWSAVSDQIVLPATRQPPLTAQSIELGRDIFQRRECFKCHGRDGRGGSVGGVEVGQDVWGRTTAAADLTSGMLRGGQRPIDIYRRIYSGINGTPMPAFKDVLSDDPDQVWHLTHFVLDLADQRRRGVWFHPPAADEPTAAQQP